MRKNLDGPVSECLISIINDFFPQSKGQINIFLDVLFRTPDENLHSMVNYCAI
jgi:hypothetical protein